MNAGFLRSLLVKIKLLIGIIKFPLNRVPEESLYNIVYRMQGPGCELFRYRFPFRPLQCLGAPFAGVIDYRK
jgi:hypothetical protein